MKILVTGGTGTLGRKLVKAATRAGHAVRILSRRARGEGELGEVEWVQADLASAEGLMASLWIKAKGSSKRIARLPLPGRTARGFREGRNTDPTRKQGQVTWREWLARLS